MMQGGNLTQTPPSTTKPTTVITTLAITLEVMADNSKHNDWLCVCSHCIMLTLHDTRSAHAICCHMTCAIPYSTSH